MTTDERLGNIENRLDAVVSALHEIGKALGIKEALERIAEKLAAQRATRHGAMSADDRRGD